MGEQAEVRELNADYHTTPKPGPDLDALARLREPFPPEAIGKLPRITCRSCSNAGNKVCSEHSKSRCQTCRNYITEKHIHLDFVGHANVTARLLDADPLWTWEPMAWDDDGLPALARKGDGTPYGLWIWLTVAGLRRPGFGEVPSATGQKSEADVVKEAIGNALRLTAMRFGVALDLWEKGELASLDDEDENPQPAPQKAAPRPAAKPKRRKPAAKQQDSKGGPSCADCGGSLAGQAVTKRDGDYVHRDGCPDGGATPDEDDGQAEDTDALNDHQQAAKLAVDELEDDGRSDLKDWWADEQLPERFADLTDEQAQAVYQVASDLALPF